MKRRLLAPGLASLLALLTIGSATLFAQKAEKPRSQAPAARQAAGALDVRAEANGMEKTREDFNLLLQNYPRLVGVVYHDPSLLADSEYVKKNGPELATFLEQHPEIAQNPEFFLGDNAQRMHDWEMRNRHGREDSLTMRMMDMVGPFLVFVIITSVLMWILKVFLENRRWGRMAKVQADVHTKLLDKFASSQDLQAYMQTEAGKRFLESAPIPIEPDQKIRMSAPLGRILWSVQVGVILAMGGLALLFARSYVPEGIQPLTVFGTLGVMLGVGFVLSAAAAYFLSRHLGLIERAQSGPASS